MAPGELMALARTLLLELGLSAGRFDSFPDSRSEAMLVLTRKLGEKIFIGHGITITVVKVARNKVRVGIDAPDQVHVVRGELDRWQEEPAACDEPADSAFTRERTDEVLAARL